MHNCIPDKVQHTLHWLLYSFKENVNQYRLCWLSVEKTNKICLKKSKKLWIVPAKLKQWHELKKNKNCVRKKKIMWLTQPLFYIEQEMTTLLLMCRHPNYSIHSKSEPAKSIILELVRMGWVLIDINENLYGPMDEHLFGWVLDNYF